MATFILTTLLTLAVYFSSIWKLLAASFDNMVYTHIILIPLVSGYLLFTSRRALFVEPRSAPLTAMAIMALGLSFRIIGASIEGSMAENDYLSFMTFGALVFWIGGFVLCFGKEVTLRAAFPLGFLIFTVPIPSFLIERIIGALQHASAEVANGLFTLTGVPYLREGFTFQLSTISIEVAEQCSGIRSSLALFITSVLAGHIFLRSGWKRFVLSLSIFPITVFKNGVRIVTLSILGAYVDPAILSSAIHKRGGIPFFILALALWAPVLWLLVKSDKKGLKPSEERLIHHD